MSLIQRVFMAILPKSWANDMRAESQRWQIRCCTCGKSGSLWDAGGIRWKATSVGKITLVKCSQCGALRTAAIELVPTEAELAIRQT
jgi:hypothetical protein